MIESRTFVRVKCDDCGNWFSYDGEGYTVFENEEQLRDGLTAPWDSWEIDGDKHYCAECKMVRCDDCGEHGHWDEDCPKVSVSAKESPDG